MIDKLFQYVGPRIVLGSLAICMVSIVVIALTTLLGDAGRVLGLLVSSYFVGGFIVDSVRPEVRKN